MCAVGTSAIAFGGLNWALDGASAPAAAVQRLDLELRGTTPAAGQQLPLFVPQAARTARLDWQLARLALTYGEDRVRRVAITDPEAPLPEDRWAWQGVGLGDDHGAGSAA